MAHVVWVTARTAAAFILAALLLSAPVHAASVTSSAVTSPALATATPVSSIATAPSATNASSNASSVAPSSLSPNDVSSSSSLTASSVSPSPSPSATPIPPVGLVRIANTSSLAIDPNAATLFLVVSITNTTGGPAGAVALNVTCAVVNASPSNGPSPFAFAVVSATGVGTTRVGFQVISRPVLAWAQVGCRGASANASLASPDYTPANTVNVTFSPFATVSVQTPSAPLDPSDAGMALQVTLSEAAAGLTNVTCALAPASAAAGYSMRFVGCAVAAGDRSCPQGVAYTVVELPMPGTPAVTCTAVSNATSANGRRQFRAATSAATVTLPFDSRRVYVLGPTERTVSPNDLSLTLSLALDADTTNPAVVRCVASPVDDDDGAPSAGVDLAVVTIAAGRTTAVVNYTIASLGGPVAVACEAESIAAEGAYRQYRFGTSRGNGTEISLSAVPRVSAIVPTAVFNPNAAGNAVNVTLPEAAESTTLVTCFPLAESSPLSFVAVTVDAGDAFALVPFAVTAANVPANVSVACSANSIGGGITPQFRAATSPSAAFSVAVSEAAHVDVSGPAAVTVAQNAAGLSVSVTLSAAVATGTNATVVCNGTSPLTAQLAFDEVVVRENATSAVVPFRVSQSGLPANVVCHAASSNATGTPQYLLSTSGGTGVIVSVLPAPVVDAVGGFIRVPFNASAVYDLPIVLSEAVADNPVDVTCAVVSSGDPSRAVVVFESVVVPLNESISAVPFRIASAGRSATAACTAQSQNGGRQYLTATSSGVRVAIGTAPAEARLLPEHQVVFGPPGASAPAVLSLVGQVAFADAVFRCEVVDGHLGNSSAAVVSPAVVTFPIDSGSDDDATTVDQVLKVTSTNATSAGAKVLVVCIAEDNGSNFALLHASMTVEIVLVRTLPVSWAAVVATGPSFFLPIVNDAFCGCDLTEGACDANCCCDALCFSPYSTLNQAFSSCWTPPFAPFAYRCDAPPSLTTENWSPFTCVAVDRNPSMGIFWPNPGIVTDPAVFSLYAAADDLARGGNPLLVSLQSQAPPLRSYASGVQLLVAVPSTNGTFALSTLRVPVPSLTGGAGPCRDSVPAEYLSPFQASCLRNPSSFAADCALGGAYDAQRHASFLAVSDGTVGVASAVANYVAFACEEEGECANFTSGYFASPTLRWPVPVFNATAGTCANAAKGVAYTVYWEGSRVLGIVTEIVLGVVAMPGGGGATAVSQSFAVDFLNLVDPALSPIPVSGHRGYVLGKPLRTGHYAAGASAVNTSLPISFAGADASGLCGGAPWTPLFGVDQTTSCDLLFSRAEFSDCDALRARAAAALTAFSVGNRVARWGSSFPSEPVSWVPVILANYSLSGATDGVDRCANVPVALSMRVVAGLVGTAQAPETAVQGVRMGFVFDTLVFDCATAERGPCDVANGTLRVPLTSLVSYVNVTGNLTLMALELDAPVARRRAPVLSDAFRNVLNNFTDNEAIFYPFSRDYDPDLYLHSRDVAFGLWFLFLVAMAVLVKIAPTPF